MTFKLQTNRNINKTKTKKQKNRRENKEELYNTSWLYDTYFILFFMVIVVAEQQN